MTTAPQYLIVARIMRPHGVRGDLRVQALTNFPDRMKSLETVYLTRDPEKATPQTVQIATVERARPDKAGYWLLHLHAIEDRDAADALREMYIVVTMADASPLVDDEVYLFQVMGLEVYTTDGQSLGRVVDIMETGANDVYVVRGETYGEVLIPAIDSVIRRIDVENGTLTIQPLPGLLPE